MIRPFKRMLRRAGNQVSWRHAILAVKKQQSGADHTIRDLRGGRREEQGCEHEKAEQAGIIESDARLPWSVLGLRAVGHDGVTWCALGCFALNHAKRR